MITKTDVTSGPAPKNPSLNNCRASTYTSNSFGEITFPARKKKEKNNWKPKKEWNCAMHTA